VPAVFRSVAGPGCLLGYRFELRVGGNGQPGRAVVARGPPGHGQCRPGGVFAPALRRGCRSAAGGSTDPPIRQPPLPRARASIPETDGHRPPRPGSVTSSREQCRPGDCPAGQGMSAANHETWELEPAGGGGAALGTTTSARGRGNPVAVSSFCGLRPGTGGRNLVWAGCPGATREPPEPGCRQGRDRCTAAAAGRGGLSAGPAGG